MNVLQRLTSCRRAHDISTRVTAVRRVKRIVPTWFCHWFVGNELSREPGCQHYALLDVLTPRTGARP